MEKSDFQCHCVIHNRVTSIAARNSPFQMDTIGELLVTKTTPWTYCNTGCGNIVEVITQGCMNQL